MAKRYWHARCRNSTNPTTQEMTIMSAIDFDMRGSDVHLQNFTQLNVAAGRAVRI
jgi:hypothetical protein